MKIAVLGSGEYDSVRKIKELLFKIKQEAGTDVCILTRGKRVGCELWVKKYTLEFGMCYAEYNAAHTPENLYSAMPESYYNKSFHPTQFLHQYDCIVKNADKIIYFGGIKPSERKHFERMLGRYKKKVIYVN